jgi:phospholipid transport system substrate-binding protein
LTRFVRNSIRTVHRKRERWWRGTTLLCLQLVLAGLAFADRTPPDPAIETRAILAQAIAIVHNTSISAEQRRTELIKLAEGKLDFALMARGSLGSHWGQLTPIQRNHFVSLFSGFLEAAYLNKIQDYASLEVQVSGERFSGGKYARVDAKVVQPGKEDIPISFMLARRVEDWVVYDVVIENVGMIENYRAQFDRVIRNHGIAQLMADLQAKQAQLGARLGNHRGAS